jgi:signal transduction histidine kinase
VETFRPYVIGTLSLVVIQAALIAGLLAQRASRRRAQGILRAREAALRTSNDRVRDLAGRLIVAQEAERARLARDLHDDACQEIAGLSVDLSRLKNDRAAAVDGDLQKALVRMQHRAARLAENLRLMSSRPAPGRPAPGGFGAALESHRREIAGLYGATLDLEIVGEVEPLGEAVRLASSDRAGSRAQCRHAWPCRVGRRDPETDRRRTRVDGAGSRNRVRRRRRA